MTYETANAYGLLQGNATVETEPTCPDCGGRILDEQGWADLAEFAAADAAFDCGEFGGGSHATDGICQCGTCPDCACHKDALNAATLVECCEETGEYICKDCTRTIGEAMTVHQRVRLLNDHPKAASYLYSVLG